MDDKSTTATAEYFTQWKDYKHQVDGWYKDLYSRLDALVSPFVKGLVLDGGSGGIFFYDIQKAEKIIALDIATPEYITNTKNERVEYASGDIRKIPFPNNNFDTVVLSLVLHHLAEPSLTETRNNLSTCIEESKRVLKKGGRLLIVESVLPRFWENTLDMLYPLFDVIVTKFLKFPHVKQFSEGRIISALVKKGFSVDQVIQVPKSKFISQFGIKVPAVISPIKVVFIVATISQKT